jgi:uncharacterized protein YcfJ
MFRKAITGIAAAGLLLAAQSALADHGRWKGPRGDAPGGYDATRGYDYARVVDVQPIYQRVRVTTPRRECYTERRYDDGPSGYPVGARRGDGAAGPMILGGIIGAAIGNQIGRGDGKRAATVAGAIIGSAIGHDQAGRRYGGDRYGRDDRYYDEPRAYDVERCDVRYDETWEERVDGYRVRYVYSGREGVTTLPYDPGDRIRVRVDVRPDEDCR